jgi:N-acetylmuramoyl-L-alanine amidase
MKKEEHKMDKNMLNDEQLNEVSGGTKIPYVVVAGDTLTAIAQKNNVSLTDLMRWNNIQDPNLIRVGQQLILKY